MKPNISAYKLLGYLLFFMLNQAVVGNNCNGDRRYENYDYIIVGAGSSGSVIASRLSENENVTVLLLEAGGPPSADSDIPLYVAQLLENKTTDWGYYIEPQKNVFLSKNEQKVPWAQYKALGGCSIHNEMLFVRGSQKDFDNWASLGASGWTWKDVLPFFKLSEDYRASSQIDNEIRGTDGYLTVSPLRFKTPLAGAYVEAGKSLGYENEDYNSGSEIGFFEAQLTQRDGRRCSTEKAFLRLATNRTNLDILTYAEAVKIEFDDDKRARSVVYERYNSTCSVTAKREIILSSGAIGSPRLLLLSGIGPEDHLKELGIPVVADLPVGLNLQNHVFGGIHVWEVNYTLDRNFSEDAMKEYTAEFQEGKGPLTSPSGIEDLIFVSTKYENASDNWPDIQITTISSLGLKAFNVPLDADVTILGPILIRPKSQGFVKLRTKDPRDKPIIDPQFLTHEEDLMRLLEGMKFCRTIIKTPALQKYDPKPVVNIFPQCQDKDWDSDDYLVCIARTVTALAHHICGTAKMGDPSDNTTVVDPELRVKGVKGLRVADASVMPVVPTANTNAASIMIGEKAAYMISGGLADTLSCV